MFYDVKMSELYPNDVISITMYGSFKSTHIFTWLTINSDGEQLPVNFRKRLITSESRLAQEVNHLMHMEGMFRNAYKYRRVPDDPSWLGPQNKPSISLEI